MGREHPVQQVLRPCHAQRRVGGGRGGDHPRALAARRQVVHLLRAVHRAHGGVARPLVPLPLHPGRALRQLPAPRLPRTLPGPAPLQGRHRRARRHLRPAGRRARADRPARLDDGGHLLRQRAGDGDLARLRVHAVPLRQGLDLGGRRAGARRRVVARHDRTGRSSDGLVHLLDLFATCLSMAGASERMPDRPLHRRGRPAVVLPGRRRRRGGVQPQVPALLAHLALLGAPGRRVQVPRVVHLRRRHRRPQPGRVHRGGAALRLRPPLQPLPRSEGDALVHDPQARLHRRHHRRDRAAPRHVPRVAEQAGPRRRPAESALSAGRARRPPCASRHGSRGGRSRPAGGRARSR